MTAYLLKKTRRIIWTRGGFRSACVCGNHIPIPSLMSQVVKCRHCMTEWLICLWKDGTTWCMKEL